MAPSGDIGMHAVSTLVCYAADTARNPGGAGLGALIAWWICARNKRNPIGGWLMYFYWSLYGGFLISLLLLAVNVNSYIPEYSGNTRNYLLFLLSAGPTVVLMFIQVIVGTFLLSARTPEVLRLLRWTLGVSAAAAAIGIAIDVFYNPENIGFGALALISDFCWFLYFLRSTRVKHVFELQDWAVAVSTIYPLKAPASN